MYCGTARKNRKGLPVGVVDANIKKREAIGQQCQHDTKKINWKDKRKVCMITSIGTNDAGGRGNKKQPQKQGANQKPLSVLRYNEYKKGIDVNDQMGSYHVNRRRLKWYRKFALDILW